MIECPYCLAQIPDRASMCQSCANPVTLVLETRARLLDVEQKLAVATQRIQLLTGETNVDLTPAPAWNARLAVVVFYVASIAATAMPIEPTMVMPLLLLMAGLLGIVIANRAPQPNAWSTAIFACAQPLIATVVILLRNPGDALSGQAVALARAGVGVSFALAVTAMATTVLYLLFFRRGDVLHSLRFPTLGDITTGADRIVKLIALVATGLTTVIALVSAASKVLSKGGS